MSYPIPTVFYLSVYREEVSGPQHRVHTSISALLRFIETELELESRNLGGGPFDCFVVNTESLECANYDIGPLVKLARRSSKTKGGTK